MTRRVVAFTAWAAALLLAQVFLSAAMESRYGISSTIGTLPFFLIGLMSLILDLYAPADFLLVLVGIGLLGAITAGLALASEAECKSRPWIFRLVLASMLAIAVLSWSAQFPELSGLLPRLLLLGLLFSNGIFFALALGLHSLALRQRSSALGLAAGLTALTWLLTTMTAPFDPFSITRLP